MKPRVGTVVCYWPTDAAGPHAAMVVAVYRDSVVNLVTWDAWGRLRVRVEVEPHRQGGLAARSGCWTGYAP